jgi:hypothetical protein
MALRLTNRKAMPGFSWKSRGYGFRSTEFAVALKIRPGSSVGYGRGFAKHGFAPDEPKSHAGLFVEEQRLRFPQYRICSRFKNTAW